MDDEVVQTEIEEQFDLSDIEVPAETGIQIEAKSASFTADEVYNFRTHFDDDEKTHSVSLRFSDDQQRAGSILVQKYPFLYGTLSDVAREGWWRLTKWHQLRMDADDPELAALIAKAEAQGNAKHASKIRKEIKDWCDNLTDALTDVLCDGNMEELDRQVSQFWDAIKIQPNQWIRDKLIVATRASGTIRLAVATLRKYGWKLDAELARLYT